MKMKAHLTQKDKQVLRKQLVLPLVFGIGIILLITGVNLAFQYMDVLTGVESVERPPMIRFIIIELVGIGLGMGSILFLTKNVRKDLSGNVKNEGRGIVKRKIIQNNNGQKEYKLLLAEQLILVVDKAVYDLVNIDDPVNYSITPFSKQQLNVMLITD